MFNKRSINFNVGSSPWKTAEQPSIQSHQNEAIESIRRQTGTISNFWRIAEIIRNPRLSLQMNRIAIREAIDIDTDAIALIVEINSISSWSFSYLTWLTDISLFNSCQFEVIVGQQQHLFSKNFGQKWLQGQNHRLSGIFSFFLSTILKEKP